MNDIVVNEASSKLWGLLFLGILMLAACAFVLVLGITYGKFFYIIIGIIALLFFGLCFAYIIKRIINPKPILIIEKNGVVDSSTAISIGFISFDDIEGFDITRLFSSKFISIYVNDLEKFTDKLSQKKKTWLQINKPFGKSPININVNTADKSPDEILQILQERLQAYKRQQNI